MNEFLQTHALYREDKTTTLTKTGTQPPAELAALMEQINSNSYANGFFKFIPPQEFQHYVSLWDLDPENCLPFIKTAFGHLIFFDGQHYQVINPVFNDVDLLGETGELDFVLDVLLCDRSALEASFLIDIYEQAFDRLGAPKPDEIYAFVPALGLGGNRSADDVQKLSMAQQLPILAQI